MIRKADSGDIPDLVILNSLVQNIHVKLFEKSGFKAYNQKMFLALDS